MRLHPLIYNRAHTDDDDDDDDDENGEDNDEDDDDDDDDDGGKSYLYLGFAQGWGRTRARLPKQMHAFSRRLVEGSDRGHLTR